MDDKLILPIEFDVNNPQLQQEINESKKAISGVGQSVSDVERRVNSDLNAISNHALKSKSSFNGLQNSINQLSREIPAFTFSAQTGFMALSNNLPIFADEIGRIRKENEALSASGQKGVPVWRQLLSGLLSWQTAMMVGITLITVYGKEIGEFFKSLIKGNSAIDESKRKLELLNGVRKESSKTAAEEIASLKILTTVASDNSKSMDERRRAAIKIQELAKSYNQNISTETILIGTLKNEYNNLTQAIIASAKSKAAEEKIQENAKKRLEIGFEVDGLKEANEERKKAIRLEGDKRSVMRIGTAMDDGARMDVIVETVKDREKASDLYTQNEIKNTNKRIEALDKEDEFLQQFIRVPLETKSKNPKSNIEKQFDNISKISKEGLEKIKALDNEYRLIVVEDDEREIQLLKQKFADFRKVLEDENEKIRKYNEKNSKTKGFKAVDLIDVSLVNPIEDKAFQQLSYTQNTGKLQKQFEEEYKLYQEYEELKKSTNEKYANERFADQLDAIKSFEQRLNDQVSKIDPNTTNALEIKRLTDLNKVKTDLADKRKAQEDKEMSEILALMISYDQKRKNLIEKQNAERIAAAKTASSEELAVLDKHHADELSKLDDSEIEKLAEVKDLFQGIDRLTDAGARTLIDKIQALLGSGKNLSPELQKKIEESLGDAIQALDDRLPERLDKVAQGFDQIANSIAGSNEELASMIGGLSNVLKATVQINDGINGLTKGIANYKTNKADGGGGILGSISAIAGIAGPVGQIVGAVGSVVSGVVSFFKASKESARQAAKAMEEYKVAVLAGEIEHNRLLRERAREQKNINELSLEQIEIQQRLLKGQTNAVESDFNNLLKEIQKEGKQITGQKTESYGGFLGIGKKTRVVDITAGLAGFTYEQLEELYTSKKMTEATAKLFEELRKSKGEIDDIANAWDSLNEEFLSRMTGGATSSTIANTIMEGFKSGKRAVVDFADDMESVVQNALLSALSATVLDEPLQELIKQFREDSKDGLSESEIEKFKEGYGSAVQAGLDALKEIEKISGVGLSGESRNSTIKGKLDRELTEKTGGEIVGIFRAGYDISKRHLIVSEKALEFSVKSNLLITEQLKHQAAIEANTAATVEQLQSAVSELKSINKNTSSKGRSAEGMGL